MPHFLPTDPPSRLPLIVVLDDDPHECTLVSTLIQECAPDCAVQAGPPSGATLRALTAPGSPRPDLILIEEDMPGRMGVDVLRILRAAPGYADVPVVILGAAEAAGRADAALRAGASAYHVRPARPDEYRALLADLLRGVLPKQG